MGGEGSYQGAMRGPFTAPLRSDAQYTRDPAPIPRDPIDREAAIHEIALLLHNSVEIEPLLATLARHVALVMRFDRCDVVLCDDNRTDHTIHHLHDQHGGTRPRSETTDDHPGYRRALDHGEPTMVTTATGTALHVPLIMDTQVIGALAFHAEHGPAYDDHDLRIAQLLAQPVAGAFRGAMLYRRERRRSQKLRALHHVGAAATTTLDRDALLAAACCQISAEFGYYKVNLATVDEHNVHIAARHRLFHGRMLADDHPDDVIPRTTPSMMTTAANQQRLVNSPDVAEDPHYYPEPGSRTRSEAAIPIIFCGRIFGVLDVQSEQINAFSVEDLQLLGLLANQLAAGLENCRLYDQVNTLLDTYVPASVARRLRADADRPVAGGARRRISVLFADLRGFTRHAEDHDPEALLQTLNRYLGIATEVVTQFGGTIDKFMGDGMMVLFNAPEDQPDHASRAVRAALLIQQRMQRLRRPGIDELHFGIGINTGDVVVGNIGAAAVLNYTAIGDAVNVAKRLQERAEGGQVLISGVTHGLVRDVVTAAPLGPLSLHNRRDPIDGWLLQTLR